MSAYPENAYCPWCGKLDGWVGRRVNPEHRCTCPAEQLTRKVESELRFTIEQQARAA